MAEMSKADRGDEAYIADANDADRGVDFMLNHTSVREEE